MRADASDAERPWVTEVWSFCAVSCAERREKAAVIDCSHHAVSTVLLRGNFRVQRTAATY